MDTSAPVFKILLKLVSKNSENKYIARYVYSECMPEFRLNICCILGNTKKKTSDKRYVFLSLI
jgi:hypothetical protein